MHTPIIYALDFDGVICDSAVETAMTGWKAANALWRDMPDDPPAHLVERFRTVRPVIETGYEAILTMRLLHLGYGTKHIFQDFAALNQALLDEAQTNVSALKALFGATRDTWIVADLADWIAMNPLFPGVADKLRQLTPDTLWYVVTTKQERFVKQILCSHAIELPDERIFGLDRNLSKPQVLQGLIQAHPGADLCFVEDRLPTLLNVQQQPTLAAVRLVFARWGYNTETDKAEAARQGFQCVELHEFLSAH